MRTSLRRCDNCHCWCTRYYLLQSWWFRLWCGWVLKVLQSGRQASTWGAYVFLLLPLHLDQGYSDRDLFLNNVLRDKHDFLVKVALLCALYEFLPFFAFVNMPRKRLRRRMRIASAEGNLLLSGSEVDSLQRIGLGGCRDKTSAKRNVFVD